MEKEQKDKLKEVAKKTTNEELKQSIKDKLTTKEVKK
jgi:hypothetical protein